MTSFNESDWRRLETSLQHDEPHRLPPAGGDPCEWVTQDWFLQYTDVRQVQGWLGVITILGAFDGNFCGIRQLRLRRASVKIPYLVDRVP